MTNIFLKKKKNEKNFLSFYYRNTSAKKKIIDCKFIIYTSGTVNKAKGVLISTKAISNNVYGINKNLNINTIKNYFRNYLRDTKFYSIFLLKPLKKSNWGKKDYTTSHFNKGEDYHLRFENLPGRKNIWKSTKNWNNNRGNIDSINNLF